MLNYTSVQYEKREELFTIPALGQHYSRRWAVEDLHEEQSESLRLNQMADPLSLPDKPGEDKDNFGGLDSNTIMTSCLYYNPLSITATSIIIPSLLQLPLL